VTENFLLCTVFQCFNAIFFADYRFWSKKVALISCDRDQHADTVTWPALTLRVNCPNFMDS